MRKINNEIIDYIAREVGENLRTFPEIMRYEKHLSIEELDNIGIIFNYIKMEYIDMYINVDNSELDERIEIILRRVKIIINNFKWSDFDKFHFLDVFERNLKEFKNKLLSGGSK